MATERDVRRMECTRKRAWQSEYVAGNVATALGWAGHGALESYKCRHCPHWHVGHVRNPRQQEAANA